MGAVNWQGLPAVLALLGVPDADVEMLLHLLEVIQTHEPPNEKA